MSPRSKIRAARVLIPVGIVLAVLAAEVGVWLVAVAIVLVTAAQLLNLRASQRRLKG
jgi:hypothetical protein